MSIEVKDILVINPGSTTTKIAVFTENNTKKLFETTIVHDEEKILSFPTIASQEDYRREMLEDYLKEHGYDKSRLSAVVGRGGMAFELSSGGYLVNKTLCERMASPELPAHASSLGAILAYDIAEELGIPSYIYDSPMGCDLTEVAKITGIAEVEKYGAIHLLNSRAMAMDYAKQTGRDYNDLDLIVCHLGGGITANAQKHGKVVDTAGYDDGPMAPERSGGVPLILFKNLCFDGKHTSEDMDRLISGKGGMYSYLGTKDCIEVEKRIEAGDEKAAVVYEAMAYQVAKSIAGLSVALEGHVDAIIITGGIAHSKMLTDMIKKYAGHLGNIVVMPGEKEMQALADGAMRMLKGDEAANVYSGV